MYLRLHRVLWSSASACFWHLRLFVWVICKIYTPAPTVLTVVVVILVVVVLVSPFVPRSWVMIDINMSIRNFCFISVATITLGVRTCRPSTLTIRLQRLLLLLFLFLHLFPHLIPPCCFFSSVPSSSSSVLQHSFYFYFYFEHLNFTWSYLIDMKISWSLDHISWSYLLILSWRSYLLIYDLISWFTILSWSLDLIIWWWSKIYELYIITYMHSTCLWLMSFIDDQHAFYTCCCATCFYLTPDMLWTHALHVFTLRTTHGH